MHSRRLAIGAALAILFGFTMSPVALGQTRPLPDDDVRRRTPARRPTPVPVAPASQPGWPRFGGRDAADVAVGANGVVWIIGTDANGAEKNIYRWDGTTFQKIEGGAVRIAVDPNGRAWVVQSTQGIFRWNGSSWDQMPGAALDVGIGANGDVWVIGSDGSIFKWDGRNWRKFSGGASRIAVDPQGNPWIVNANNQIFRWKGADWELLPGSARDISVGPDGAVYIVSTTAGPGGFQIQRWRDGQWIAEPDAVGTIAAAGPSGELYLQRASGTLVRRPAVTTTPAPDTALAGTAPPPTGDEGQLCWKKTFGRGVGTVPGQCSSTQDKDAGLCYPKCPSGYKGVGPVCWQSCPDGWRDDGAFCAKPEPYGRGGGYPWKFGDSLDDSGMRSRCESDHGAGNCEKDGAVYYPKCKANFHKVGCCICSPDCPSGMADIGVSCTKKTSTRDVGTVPNCGAGLSYDAGLCYEGCPRDFDGVGPLCWGKCPPDFPFPCGAGCAVSEMACGAAVTEMTLETVSFVATSLSWFYGGPGIVASAKAAAKAGAKAAGKVALQGGFKSSMSSAMKSAAKPYAKAFARTFLKTYWKNPRNIAMKGYTVSKVGAKTATSIHAANVAAHEMGTLKAEGQFDYTNLMMLDITGFSSMIYSFAKYGSCSIEDLASNVDEVDFGPGPASATDVRTIELTVQNPTTITEVTSSPFSGCSIIPDADCAGKTLQPGQKCNINVKVAGSGKIVGEVHVYTTAYDIIPLAIGVKANSAATSDCAFLDAEDAVNLSSLAGVWAWKDDQSQKFVIKNDGSVTSPLGNGTIRVIDPVARTFAFAAGAQSAVITLNAEHDRFTLVGGGSIPTSAVRRPWDSRCKPGEQFYAGLCYDVPVGYEITVPGFIGKPCGIGWRDDGVQCYPPWTGPKFANQADADGTLPMQRPILVTDCPTFSPVQGNKACPANFKKTLCTCEAQPTSKEVKSLIGKVP